MATKARRAKRRSQALSSLPGEKSGNSLLTPILPSAQNQASGESASITPPNTDPGQARIAMASGDRERDFDGDTGRGDGVEPARHPAPDSPSQGQPGRDAGDDPDPRAIRTPPAGAYGFGDPWYDDGFDEFWAAIQPRLGFGEPGRGHNLAPPRRPVNAADAGAGLKPQRPWQSQAAPRAEAVPGSARATRADELQALQGPQGWPWLMTPVEESVPAAEGTTGLAAWLWIVIVIGVVTLALAGLVEWLR
jgi:hypothetical protein